MKQSDKNRLIRYFSSPPKSLFECYKAPSRIKQQIYRDIQAQCFDDNGHDLKIISANSHSFSAGYLFTVNGEEFLKYFTKSEIVTIPTEKFRKEVAK